ncbi:MAG: hypothetical protein P4M04_13270 [Acidobacteriota bacterium]|nr:hypothetical protein [Acidobacteriota bacterium]
MIRLWLTWRIHCLGLLVFMLASAAIGLPQSCFNGPELDAPTRSAIESAAHRYLDMSAKGDVAGLKANAIAAIIGDFGSIENAVVTNKQFLADGPSTITGTYLLDASQSKTPLARADFYCGIYNSADRVGFFISNLPPGRYAVVIQNVKGKDPVTLTLILQDVSGAWKLAGYYPRLDTIGGHDGQWYLTRAREYKPKGQAHNAWFYYLTAWNLMAPVNFMSTVPLDKLADEMQTARPSDLPSADAPMNLSAGGKTYRATEMTAVPVENNLDLRVKIETSDAANPALAFQDNMAVGKAIVAKYPEVRDAFSAVIVRAVDNNGHDFGSVLPMKDVK